MPPILRTTRLILRAPLIEDRPSLARHYGDPQHFDSLGGRRPTPDDAQLRAALMIDEAQRVWRDHGFGPFAMRAGAEFIGLCGFLPKPADDPGDEPRAMLMFGVAARQRRCGYASEGASAALDWFDANHPAIVIEAASRPDNVAAARVLIGLAFDGPYAARLYATDVALFRRSSAVAAADMTKP